MKISLSFLLFAILLFGCSGQEEESPPKLVDNSNTKEVLLIGTFHYNNPGADLAKTKSFDVMNEKSQQELKKISSNIKKYNPTKVFVEWPYNEQKELDSLYHLYTKGQYFQNDSLSDFYLKNEIFQLAFRTAKENNLKTVYGIDYNETTFPFGDVMADIEKSNQPELKSKIEDAIAKFTTEFDNKIVSGASLLDLTYYLNSPEMRSFSNHFHNNLMLLAGTPNDFSGPFLTSEWFKRNLYMWSLIQKNTGSSDQRIMVLAGASHAAMFELFITENKGWKVKELNEIMKE
ncbi:hypothetical protein DKG77_03400 [Flagellimonas aquimarina]|uniref:TraB/GumN family protein n=1 Tax=Flagellimonas aquimarina TaxID=2201895 RepID=A0A316L4N7_9FLAO|nr:DUF5694 domain-containing protein [Allomuricauda koreensis]PWL39889.1 hypothetical protein DKG77_03400 [Allomuricauda koreensis]